MKTTNKIIKMNDQIPNQEKSLHHYYVQPEACDKPTPTILIFPSWAGQDTFAREKAQLLAQKGYIGIAIDLYGEGRVGKTVEQCSALMMPFMEDRSFLRNRIAAIIKHLQKDPHIDAKNMIAMGYCFGGLCVLDTVRNNLGLKAGISIHGLFSPPDYDLPQTYHAKVLALHGYRDPMVTPIDVHSFEQELHRACADWQLIAFGQGKHAFTNPLANDESLGTVYHPLLDQRTTKYVDLFLQELLD